MNTTALHLEQLSRRFNEHWALNPVSLDIPAGAFTSILGPSGCGKTTLLMLLAGIDRPSGGKIILNNQDITHLPCEQRHVGVVFQSYALFPNLTVSDNILYGLHAKQWNDKQRRDRLDELLELVQLRSLTDAYPAELSGGQQQRVAIARALAPRPQLLLLDEPLSALDAWSRSAIGQELRMIQRKTGITTVMVTHDRTEALSLSDYLIVMRPGYVEQSGTPEAIYDNPQTEFVATFIGGMNILHMQSINNGLTTGIRYSDVALNEPTEDVLKRPHTFVGKVESLEFMGDKFRVGILLNDFSTHITADIGRTQIPNIAMGELLCVTFAQKYWCQW